MREHGGTMTVDTETHAAQAITLERMADAGTIVLVSRSAAGTSTYRLCKQQQFQPGQPVTWEPGGKPIPATVVRVTPKHIKITFRNVHGGAELRWVLPGNVRPDKQ